MPEVTALKRCLRTWTGIGHIIVGMDLICSARRSTDEVVRPERRGGWTCHSTCIRSLTRRSRWPPRSRTPKTVSRSWASNWPTPWVPNPRGRLLLRRVRRLRHRRRCRRRHDGGGRHRDRGGRRRKSSKDDPAAKRPSVGRGVEEGTCCERAVSGGPIEAEHAAQPRERAVAGAPRITDDRVAADAEVPGAGACTFDRQW
jgi:hypothetical protein